MRYPAALVFLIIAGLCACSDPTVAVYDAPKEEAAALPASEPSAPAQDVLTWKTPAGWKQTPGTGMRLATLTPPGGQTDMSIVQLAGDAGGELANMNRWRGQMGLEAVASLGEGSQSVTTPVGKAMVVDLTGKDGKSMLGAIISHGEQTWFFKLTGPAAAVAEAKPGFLSFIRSLHHGS